MEKFDVYVLVLCCIVYIGLVALFSVLITMTTKQTIKLTRLGTEDEKIKTEYLKKRQKKNAGLWGIIEKVISLCVCTLLVAFFVFSLTVNAKGCNSTGDVPVFRVVASSSMASKYKGNEYLFENNINNQLQTFDVVLTHKLPAEEDLKLYDIVVYEVDGIMLIHRIVDIEEPNEKHSERYFLLQGDAVQNPDRYPVTYSQMRGIYRNQRIPFIGTFVFFMQSPAGFLCMGLIVFATIITPIIEKKLNKEYLLRLIAMGLLDADGNFIEQTDIAVLEEIIVTQEEKKKKVPLTFAQKLKDASQLLKDRYKEIVTGVLVCSKIKETTTKNYQSFYCGKTPIAKILIKGDILCVYLAVDKDAIDQDTDFITHETVSRVQDDFPVHVNVTSEYKVEKIIELAHSKIQTLKESGKIKEKDLEIPAYFDFDLAFGLRKEKSLAQRIKEAPAETRERYREIVDYAVENRKVILKEARKYHTLKVGAKSIARISMRGNALRVYLALDPKEFINSEHKFLDQSTVKEHEKFPMLVKVTSNKKVESIKELIDELV
jgi:signal peptidase I